MRSHRRRVNCVELTRLQQQHVQQTLFSKGDGEVGEEKWKLRAWKSWVRKGIWGFYLLFVTSECLVATQLGYNVWLGQSG